MSHQVTHSSEEGGKVWLDQTSRERVAKHVEQDGVWDVVQPWKCLARERGRDTGSSSAHTNPTLTCLFVIRYEARDLLHFSKSLLNLIRCGRRGSSSPEQH